MSLQAKWQIELQLVTDITLRIAFEEPALIKEMIDENSSKLLLSRIMAECTNLINNMATGKVLYLHM